MPETHYKVRVESDHIKKLASAKPIPALAELIWNAADADASRIDVEIESNDFGMQAITVRDNGHGISHDEVEGLFGKLGGSWKAHGNRSKTKSRILHGKEGKGRFKALALGRVADWTVIYRHNGKLLRYTITILREDLVDVRVSEPTEVDSAFKPGVEVRITELDRSYRSLEPDQALHSLAQIFALYLTDYSDIAVYIEHQRVDPSALIASRQTLPLSPIIEDGVTYTAALELIEWTSASERWIFLCGDEGFPFHRISPTFHVPGAQFSAYLKSSFISELQKRGVLELAEMNGPLQAAYEEAEGKIKLFFRNREVEAARSEIEQWKADEIYPYRDEPKTAVERAERKVFEIVALNVNNHLPEFSDANRKTKAFQLRMLRQAIERGPDELQLILKEVLDLPERKQQELAKLLEEADLANVISASKLVSDRMKFVHGLEALLFDPDSKKLLKERSQLHRMLAENNTWVFGEQFNLTVDDQSLTEVLRKHRKLIGDDTIIDTPVKRIDGKVGIVDLMLSRSVPRNHADEREHLVVELKRPTVKVGADEITQVEKYAYTVADDERFRHLKTRWTFWVISNDLDGFAQVKTRQKDKPKGQISQTDDGRVEVWVKTWSEIIAECKARMHFVQQHLQANVDKESSLKYLKKTYDKYLSGVVEVDQDTVSEPADA
ncbi:ATP-binding protein [Mesorhizobium sp.]|uniref:ATP-binding protein n=1 Tax=Mesorhizobium sp. TaxID=1871066 RepID=UPI000FE9B9EA|nr:ATP-binding protein [Mesorhizobium sp.]RWA78224.1 MAG: ATP-binding protein [Mesorhizobium sp.]